MNPIEFAKAHPIGTTVGAVVVIAAVILFMGGGGGGGTVSPDGGMSDVGASTALAQIQAQQQASMFAASAQKELGLAQIAAEQKSMEYGREVALATLTTQSQLEMQRLQAEERTTTLVSTLQAKLSGDKIKADSDATAAMYSSLRAQMESQSQIALATINANVAMNAENNRPKGLFSWLFG